MTQAGLQLFTAVGLTPRPYQTECLAAVAGFMARGGKRACVVIATGGGKTFLFAQVPRMVDGRVLILAHREELLDQAAGKLLEANPGLSVAIEQADRKAPPGTQVVVASVPTLYGNRRRLEALDPAEFGAVVVDEVHHIVARSFLTVLAHFGLCPDVSDLTDSQLSRKELAGEVRQRFTNFKPAASAPFLWGTTATPSRSDGRGLEFVLDEIVYQKTMPELIDAGYLAPVRGIKVRTETDLSDVKVRAGDFAEDDLATAVNTPKRNALVVKAYHDHAPGRKAILFAASVEHARTLASLFNETLFGERRYRAATIFGSTPKEERRNVFAAFKRGDIDVLSNYATMSEGVDVPDCSCILMSRPTKSQLVYSQMMGRGSRIAPGKTDLLVIDLVDAGKVGVVTVNTLFGLPPKLNVSQIDTVTASKRVAEIAENIPLDLMREAVDLDAVRAAAAAFDPLKAAQPEPYLMMSLSWVRTPYGYALGMGDRGSFGLVVNALGHAEARYKPAQGPRETLGYCHSVQEGIDRAERWVMGRFQGLEPLLKRGARWQKEPPSPGQLRRMYALGIKQMPAEKALYSAYVAMANRLGVRPPDLSKEQQRAAQETLADYQGRSKGDISLLFNAQSEKTSFSPNEE